MDTYDREKMKHGDYWSFCAECKDYSYVPKDTREHQMKIHARSQEDVDNNWPD